MTTFFVFLMIAALLILIFYGIMEEEWFPLQAYALGLLICFLVALGSAREAVIPIAINF